MEKWFKARIAMIRQNYARKRRREMVRVSSFCVYPAKNISEGEDE